MSAPATMAEAVHMIDMLQAELDKAQRDLDALRTQLKLSDETTAELVRMVDAVRAERDTWRAEAGR